jgi:ATP-dependent exoDNAse (exonuclease V) beta subunit
VPDHPDAYLQRFLDVVLEYSRKNPPSISGFLSWWDENKDKESCAVVLPAGENAIRVMSIHKSKGLQFPVVIMPFVNWKLKPKPESTLWVSSDEPPFNQVPAHLVHFRSLLEHSVFASQYHDEIRHTLMDQINMLYVAFTRAEEQLYVIAGQPKSWKPGSGKAASNAGELTRNVLAVLHDGADAVDEQGCFESGSPAGPLREPYARDRSVRAVDNWISSPWRHRMQMVVNRRKTAATDPEIPDTAYGVLFHELMSSVLAPADPEEIVGSHKLAEDASEDTRERLLRDIRFFMKSAEQYNWFPADATILTETDLLLPDGTIFRPDRMVISNRHVTIIDYKTGTEEPAHESQVRQYATVLKEMGYQTIDAFLLYPALSRVVQVNS